MFRFLFRLAATIALAVAVIMAVLDATRTVAASQLVLTPLDTSWLTVSPDTLARCRPSSRDQDCIRWSGTRSSSSFSTCRASPCSACSPSCSTRSATARERRIGRFASQRLNCLRHDGRGHREGE